MKNKIFAFLVAIVLLCACLPLGAVSVSAAIYGDLTYEIANGKVTITDCYENATTVVIPSTIEGYPVTTIGEEAFMECTYLKSLTIPDSVTVIDDYAFYICSSLQSLTIPKSVSAIGERAFGFCDSITSFDVARNNAYYCDVDGVLFNKDKTTLIKYPVGKSATSYAIPKGVTTIEDLAFDDSYLLTSVTIPDSVTTIGLGAFIFCGALTSVTIPASVTNIEEMAFGVCDSVTAIDVDANNPHYCDVDGVLFNKNKTTLMQYPAGNPSTSYVIPDSVTAIGGDAFYGCDYLKSVTIPDSVLTIGDSAFYDCESLDDVYYGGTEEDWDRIAIGEDNEFSEYTVHYTASTEGKAAKPKLSDNVWMWLLIDMVAVLIVMIVFMAVHNHRKEKFSDQPKK